MQDPSICVSFLAFFNICQREVLLGFKRETTDLKTNALTTELCTHVRVYLFAPSFDEL